MQPKLGWQCVRVRSMYLLGLAILAVAAPNVAQAQQAAKKKNAANYPPRMEGAKTETYKKVGDVSLDLYVFTPPGHKASDRRAAIVFFFGGGWTSGTPQQFLTQCQHLASRGMVAIAADYRVASRHQVKPAQCVADAKSAVRWVRVHADKLGVDPKRIAAGGGSAGGHLAAATGVVPDFEEAGEDQAVSARPNALVLFNPALTLAPVDGDDFGREGLRLNQERLGAEPTALSPTHHVAAGAPPTIIFHGKADSTVPYVSVEVFAKKMKAAGNRCELIGYEGQQHGFFNFGRNNNEQYRDTLQRMDEFLTSLGYLETKTDVKR